VTIENGLPTFQDRAYLAVDSCACALAKPFSAQMAQSKFIAPTAMLKTMVLEIDVAKV
jgi:hypothetical protein